MNGLLAAELAMDSSDFHAPWRAVLPTVEDFRESMPLLWPSELQSLLPPAAILLLEKQKRKFSRDYTAVSVAFPSLSFNIYSHHWLLVSTRTFYYTPPDMKPDEVPDSDECLALVPFGDYFNHSDNGCKASYSASGYEICAYEPIEKGQELYISYGNHSNDFLLVEYGFILEENRWDEISLDDVILPLFSEKQKKMLKDEGYLGSFLLDKETVCYRTIVALRLLCMPLRKWRRSLANGFDEDDIYQRPVNELLLRPLGSYLELVDRKLQHISMVVAGTSSQRDIVRKRWEQIRILITTAISRIET